MRNMRQTFWEKEHGKISQEQLAQSKSGQLQLTLNIELTPV